MSQTLDNRDRSLIEELCFRLTGSRPESLARIETCSVNLMRRMSHHGLNSLREYLSMAMESDQEFAELVSALTIHTTSWFREAPHFERLHALARPFAELNREGQRVVFRVLSAACSSGEEVYTMALVLESVRALHPNFEYSISGWDIDPVSVDKARAAIYDRAALEQIPREYHRHLLLGTGPTEGLFTLSKSIRQRCSFQKQSLESIPSAAEKQFNVIFCRNVLIYFKPEQVEKIVQALLRLLVPQGSLVLGHSEGIEARKFGLKNLGSATYQLDQVMESRASEEQETRKASILIVDDSPIAKMALRRALESRGCAVESVKDFREASQLIRKKLRFDQAVVDLALTTQDHNHWVEEQRRKGALATVVVIGSNSGAEAHSALGALEHGAQDFVDKRRIIATPEAVADQLLALLQKAQAPKQKVKGVATPPTMGRLVLRPPKLFLIGASTGGTEALMRLLKDMPRPCPPVLVVQHIANSFAKSFAERLAEVSGLKLGQPTAGSEIVGDTLYMAWDDYHIGLKSRGGLLQLDTSIAPPQHSVRPAVDYLFQSALHLKDPDHFMAVLLTGMGKDGARGLLQLKQAGAMTLTQDESSSVVYGMPGEAMALGASCYSGNPEMLRVQMNQALALHGNGKKRA